MSVSIETHFHGARVGDILIGSLSYRNDAFQDSTNKWMSVDIIVGSDERVHVNVYVSLWKYLPQESNGLALMRLYSEESF